MGDNTVSTELRLSPLPNSHEPELNMPPISYPSAAVSRVFSPKLPQKRKIIPSKSKHWDSYITDSAAIFAEEEDSLQVLHKVSTALTLSLPNYPSVVSLDLCPDPPLIGTKHKRNTAHQQPVSEKTKNNNVNGSRIAQDDNDTAVSTVLSLSSLNTSHGGVSLPHDDDQEPDKKAGPAGLLWFSNNQGWRTMKCPRADCGRLPKNPQHVLSPIDQKRRTKSDADGCIVKDVGGIKRGYVP